MSTINRYVLADIEGNEKEYEFDTMDEAIAAATDGEAVIERTYTYDDSELVWTPDGSTTWPPKRRARKATA